MSAAVFYNGKINWKLWTVGCFVAAGAVTFSACLSHEEQDKAFLTFSKQGLLAEKKGDYRASRRAFDLALLQARQGGRKEELLRALLNCARCDSLFNENGLPKSLAEEAYELSLKLHGPEHENSIQALLQLAALQDRSEDSLVLYKKALQISRVKYGTDHLRVAEILVDLSMIYFDLGQEGAALSSCKAARYIFENSSAVDSPAYARALLNFAFLADIDAAERVDVLRKALELAEGRFGKEHPELVPIIEHLAAAETDPVKKLQLLKRAVRINERTFGALSEQLANDLVFLADVEESAGKEKDALRDRVLAAQIFQSSKDRLEYLSAEFLDSYADLLRKLKFDREASRIDAILSMKKLSAPAAQESREAERYDIESEPEYWQRTELQPIAGIEKFCTAEYDNLQIWYQKGRLRLEAFKQGEIVFEKYFAECPTGILNISAQKDSVQVSWRDGEGPIWHHDRYKIRDGKIELIAGTRTDAYAEELNRQLEALLAGDEDAMDYGAVESVPASYINNNFIADAIGRAERKALKLYGMGDPAAAANCLSRTLELMSRAINIKRTELKQTLSHEEAWLDAFAFQGLPLNDYLAALNDYGFFLQQSGSLKESALVLELVTKLSPERAVAQLNLADSLWSLGSLKEACLIYQRYLDLKLQSAGPESVPSRVYRRLSTAVPAPVPVLRGAVLGV